MNLFPRNNKTTLGVLLLVVFLLFVDRFSNRAISQVTRSLAAPVIQVGGVISRTIFGDYFSTRAGLQSTVSTQRLQIKKLEEKEYVTQSLQDENTSLRALLHLPEKDRTVTVEVSSSLLASPYGTFQISIGSGTSPSIKNNDLVLSSEGFVIGRVSEVGTHTSNVRMLFAPDNKIEAVSGTAAFTLQGAGAGVSRAELPRGIPLKEGDTVLSPELHFRPVGIIGNISTDTGGASSRVLVRLPLSLTTLRFVTVVSQ